jgi:hypothetical protein
MLLDLSSRPLLAPEAPSSEHFKWEEFAALWDSNDLAAAHDWLNERWSRLVRNRPGGQQDPEAQFLQALAFAVLALFFTQTGNQEGARLMIDDALVCLGKYRPGFLGVRVDPILATLNELRPLLAGLAPDADCPVWPFVYNKFEYQR